MALPRSVPLLGPDVVLLAMETRTGGGGNAVLVVELDAAVEAARLERALERFLPLCPWLGGRLSRPRPWGKLAWRVAARGPTRPEVRRTPLAAGGLAALVDHELDVPIDPRRETPLRFTLADSGGGCALVLTWSHPLMDPRGGEYLVRLLAELDEHDGATPPWPRPPRLVAPPETRSWREQAALASRGAAHLRGLAPVPPVSLAGTRAGGTTRRHRRVCFVAEPPASDRTRRGMPWRLAVVAKAMTALWVRRGLPTDVPFLIPVSIDRRPRGEPGPLLGNYLGFHFARCLPPLDGDVPTLARALRAELAEAVRRDDLEAGWVGMRFARYRPPSGMFRELPWAAGGDFCSFNFADTGTLLPERTHLFGSRIRGGYHVAAVPARPGAGVFFTRAGATENLVVSWAGDVLDDADAEQIAGVVQREMGWDRI